MMGGLRLISALAAAIMALGAWGFPLKVRVDTTRTAILVRDLQFGVDILAENVDRSLIPASVMKSVTVASLLNLAESTERFVTPVIAEGEVRDSVLRGDVVVKCCGDPTIESRFLDESQGFADSIAAGLRRLGIREVAGRIVIDESEFPDATTPPGWMAEDIPWPYGARLQGANFRDNRFRLRLPSKETDPYVPDLKFSYVGGRKGVSIDRKDGSETMIVKGGAKRGISDTFSMPYPSKVMRAEIEKTLRREGIKIGGAKMGHADRAVTVYRHLSPTFGEIMQSLMHRSDNLMAEGMLRALTPGGTRADALMEEQAVWAMAGVSVHGVKLVDGSGLSRDNRLTARFLADVLQHMLGDAFASDYTMLFPRAGFDGTMKGFLAETPLAGRLAMKTGSMKGVQSYAGYLFDEEGRPTHIVVFMSNGFRCGRAALKNDLQRLLLEIFNVDLQNEQQ